MYSPLHLFLIGILAVFLLTGCASIQDSEVGRTPVGSVVSGETQAPSDYFDRVSERNQQELNRAGENPTFQPGYYQDNFRSPSPFPVRD